jgi:hypothetical protein
MQSRRTCALTIVASVLLLSTTLFVAGGAAAFSISHGGFDQALGCSDVACGATQTLGFDTSTGMVAEAAGEIDLDTSALTLSFAISVLELSLIPVAGGDDIGVSQIVFSKTSYTATALALINMGEYYIVAPKQTASIQGTQTQVGGFAAPSPFFAPDARVTGICLAPEGALVCGLSFGQTNFSLPFGSDEPEERHFQHTANLIAVPEASTAWLIGIGLVGMALAGRKR